MYVPPGKDPGGMDEGGFYMSKYECGYPEWEKEPRPCDNPNEQPPVECAECFYGREVADGGDNG